MKLGAFIHPSGHHIAAWRHPDAFDMTRLSEFVQLARMAEDAKFDCIFLADHLAVRLTDPVAASRRSHSGMVPFEPMTLLSALAGVTTNIGLLATASTSFTEPFNLARQFQSLDLLSGGRSGWNLVTSSDPDSALNFGLEGQTLHADRYARAEEFADIVIGLWKGWEQDAFPRDRKSGQFFELDKMHPVNFKGKYFSVKGPLNLPPSPQGRPVMVQAGGSEPGKMLAARTAEVVFASLVDLTSSQQFYADLKGRMAQYGRDQDELKVMPGVAIFVGRTRAEAEAKLDQLQELVQPEVGLDLLSGLVGFNLRDHPIDGPVPEMPESNAGKSRQNVILDRARRDNLTIKELYLQIAGGRGHLQIVGTPQQIADHLQERFETYAADGFNVMAPVLPGGLKDFIELVMPELRRRNLIRSEYDGNTLRDNLDLKKYVKK
jgi:FMN-dependent oxidoreductase (nitrilotriacetate monooxygenase family)